MAGTAIALLIAVLILSWYWAGYNSLINARIGIDQCWSNIEVELKRRIELITNLIQVTKGYAAHEQSTFERAARARTLAATSSAQEASRSEPEVSGAAKSLLALSEAYPNLKADTVFLELQRELTTTENRIAERRNAYNQMVTRYSNLCQTVPLCFIARAHDFTSRAFFDAPDDEVANAPKVGFP